MDILSSSSDVNGGMLVEFVGGGVVLRLRGEMRCGVVSRARMGVTRRFFFVEALTDRIL